MQSQLYDVADLRNLYRRHLAPMDQSRFRTWLYIRILTIFPVAATAELSASFVPEYPVKNPGQFDVDIAQILLPAKSSACWQGNKVMTGFDLDWTTLTVTFMDKT